MKPTLIAIVVVLAFASMLVYAADTGSYSLWTECTKICDTGVQTRTCSVNANPTGTDCTAPLSQICNTEPCPNCTVTPYWTGYGDCTKECGGGTYWRSRSIIQDQGIGGTPCPQLNFTYECRTDMCTQTIHGKGFYFWQLKGPGPLTFTVRRYNTEIDVFLFDEKNFLAYQWDAQRMKPYQTGYVAMASSLNIDTVKSVGPVTLSADPNVKYFLVVDHTLIGAADGTTVNGQQEFLTNTFAYKIEGLEVPVGYNTAPTSGATATASASVAVVAILATVVAAFAL